MRILFVKPPFNKFSFINNFMVCEPLEFEMLAASISSYHDVNIVDLRVENISFIEILKTYMPDIVGFSALTMEVNIVKQLANDVKKYNPQIITCVGGEHASLMPESFEVAQIDFIFQYDSLNTFPKFVEHIEVGKKNGQASISDMQKKIGKRIVNPLMNDNLNESPLPKRELCEKNRTKYVYGCATPVNLIQTSAGCPYRCTFCSIPARQAKYRVRKIDRIIEDIGLTKSKDLLSIDANALNNVEWSKQLYTAIGNANMSKRLMISCRTDTIVKYPELLPILAKSGVSVIAFGIETNNNEALTRYNKDNTGDNNTMAIKLVHQYGMMVRANFIIEQDFGINDFQNILNIVNKYDIEFPTFQILTPLPGTQFYNEMSDKLITHNLDLFDLSHSVLPTKLPIEVFHDEFKNLFRICYGAKRLLWLSTRIPLTPALKGIWIATKSHFNFSYHNHILAYE